MVHIKKKIFKRKKKKQQQQKHTSQLSELSSWKGQNHLLTFRAQLHTPNQISEKECMILNLLFYVHQLL